MHSIVFSVILLVGGVVDMTWASTVGERDVSKRSTLLFADEFLPSSLFASVPKVPSFSHTGPWLPPPRPLAPSPAEVSNIIASAKQASTNVLIAQQQVQAAKENVLNQQRVAMEKESNAAILTQKSETAAAVQRSEAAAAAQAVILAQHRLAAAKASVSHQQRIAAAKEAEAAAALQSSAQAAAAEIHRTEAESAKFANLHRNGAASIAHHVTATKDAIVAPLSSGTNHVPSGVHPWQPSYSTLPWGPTGPATSGSLYVPPKPLTIGHLWG